jgi:hypothetical protein
MRIPFGFWFVNRGARDGKILKVDFSDKEISTESLAKFNLFIISGKIDKISESIKENIITIDFPKNDTTHFSFVGDIKFYNAMKSIITSIEKVR